MSPVTLTAEEAQTIVWALRVLNLYMPTEEQRSGFQDRVMDQLACIVSEIQTPLVPAGSESWMADFFAKIVDGPQPHADVLARGCRRGRPPPPSRKDRMMAKAKYTPAQIRRAVNMVRNGATRSAAAKATGMHIGAVRNHSLNAGVVAARSQYGHRTAFRPGSRPFSDHDDATILALRDEGKGYRKIGVALGRNPGSIRSRILTLDQIALRSGEDVTTATTDRILTAICNGQSVAEIAKDARTRPSTITGILRDAGLQVRELRLPTIDAGSQQAWAKAHDLSPAYVNDVLQGRREPAGKILAALGLEKIVFYRKVEPALQDDAGYARYVASRIGGE